MIRPPCNCGDCRDARALQWGRAPAWLDFVLDYVRAFAISLGAFLVLSALVAAAGAVLQWL